MNGTEPNLSKGDWVYHPRMPAWGYGKILEMLSGNKGRVFFLLAGEKKISLEHAGLSRVESDTVSQAALNDQITEFKIKLARDLLTSEELSREVTSVLCESFSSTCELCGCKSETLRIYSIIQKGKMCLCDTCRDNIMLETKNRAEINKSISEMEKRSKKKEASANKEKKKAKALKK